MSYSPSRDENLFTSEESRVSKDISICQAVKDTIESDGWKNTIGPTLDKMIVDVLGGKIGDNWISGKIDSAKKEGRREFYIGYKQALIDLHSRIMFHLQQLPLFEENLRTIQAQKTPKFRQPFTGENSSYDFKE
jgi:hypothetical protein